MKVNPKYFRVDLQGGRLDGYGYMRQTNHREAVEIVRHDLVHAQTQDAHNLPEVKLTEVPPGTVLMDMGYMPAKGKVYWDFLNFSRT